MEGLQNIDVLLVPIGGFYTIDTGAAIQVIERVKPRIAIPMHFKTPCLDGNFPFADETRFCALTGATRAKAATLEITKENLTALPHAIVLPWAGFQD